MHSLGFQLWHSWIHVGNEYRYIDLCSFQHFTCWDWLLCCVPVTYFEIPLSSVVLLSGFSRQWLCYIHDNNDVVGIYNSLLILIGRTMWFLRVGGWRDARRKRGQRTSAGCGNQQSTKPSPQPCVTTTQSASCLLREFTCKFCSICSCNHYLTSEIDFFGRTMNGWIVYYGKDCYYCL